MNGGTPVPTSPLVWRTSDGGTTWIPSQLLDVSGLSEIYVPSNIQFVGGQNGWLLTHVGVGMNHDYVVLYRTSDGGATWARLIDPYNDGGIQSCSKNAILFTDVTHGWLTGDCGGVKAGALLFKTADAGYTWQEVALPAPTTSPNVFKDGSNFACGTYNPFFFGNDLGHMSVRCTDYNGPAVSNNYFIYTTQDGGNTWKSATYPGDALYFFSADTGWATSFKVQLTTDGGASWKPIADITWVPQLDFISEQIGWAVATSGDQVALVKTVNGGAKWSILIPTVAP